jgi:selenocysteine lyase/cysteine desulfurase
MIKPLVKPGRFIMPAGTVSHMAGPLGGLPWKTSKRAFSRYCLELASGVQFRNSLAQVSEAVRTQIARLVGGTQEEVAIAFALSATEALDKLLECIEGQFNPGTNIVTPRSSYPALIKQAQSLNQRSGTQIRQPIGTTSGVIAAIDENTRLVLVEQFDTWSCEMFDLAAIAEAARRVGARIVVDASQTLGLFPLDYHYFDAAIATAYKGLGGLSNGSTPILINRAMWQAADLKPRYAGRNAILSEGGFQFEGDLGDQLQMGGLPGLNLFMLRDALRNMEKRHLTPEKVAQHIQALNHEIVEALLNLTGTSGWPGLFIISAHDPQLVGPHITVKMLPERAAAVCARLIKRGVYLSYDGSGLRLGSRYHNGSADVERTVEQLGKVLLKMEYSVIDPSWMGRQQ